MQNTFIRFGHFFAASLLTFILASIVHSQFVMYGLTELGIVISPIQRFAMTWDDILGLFASLGAVISLSLLLAFLSVYGLNRWQPSLMHWLKLLYPLAGALAIWLMLTAMQPIMHITLIASARTPLGVTSLCLCGAIGGGLYWHLRSEQALRLQSD